MSHQSIYLTLFHFAKGICGMAARDSDRSCHLLRVLHDLRTEMTAPIHDPAPQGEERPDIQDALPRRRGRLRKREIPNATVRAAKANKETNMIVTCDLCEGPHQLDKCPDYDLVLGARLPNVSLVPGPGQRKCRLCGGYGHQRRTCPCRSELRARRDQQQAAQEEED